MVFFRLSGLQLSQCVADSVELGPKYGLPDLALGIFELENYRSIFRKKKKKVESMFCVYRVVIAVFVFF